MFEFAIDIPWRMEPAIQADGSRRYDPVPITIAIHDEDTNPYSGSGRIWNFCKLEVSRYRDGQAISTQTFLPSQLAWIERTGRPPSAATTQATYWPMAGATLAPPTTSACYPGTQNCDGYDLIYNTSEWHALARWDPGVVLPGFKETLQLVAYVSASEDCFSRHIKLINYARAHWAADPLPRFGDERWLYGDLHYHSQSTDNEGESAYSYRAVASALGAMGIDFTYATDHASDSQQIVDVDRADWGDLLPERFRGLRDLNLPRWDAALSKLHGVSGANADVAGGWPQNRRRVPRLFLGAEVDVAPEVGLAPNNVGDSGRWLYQYGNGRTFSIFDWTTDGFIDYWGSVPLLTAADIPLIFQPFTDRSGNTAYKLGDVQGWNERAVGRQHLIHLPRFAEQPSGFVSSKTTKYGGASRHAIESNTLGAGVLPEIASKQGIAFLAHPLAAGGGGPGPGIAPFSDYQYTKLFDQQPLVGLQLWNENTRTSSHWCPGPGVLATACIENGEWESSGYSWLSVWSGGTHMDGWNSGVYRFAPMYNHSSWSWQRLHFGVEQALHNGAFVWDRMLRWGLDRGRTDQIAWLPPGEPRRMFMAGGSDAHGDWNYRREGYMFEPSSVNDTALAKVRNLVFAGRARTGCRPTDMFCADPVPTASQSSHDQPSVTDALAEGKFSVTDGPAVRLVVDRNRNGVIDETDYPMGSIVDLYGEEALPIIVEWQSTQEFGVVDRVDLYVGVDADPQCSAPECLTDVNESRARTYAPPDHGVRRDWDERTMIYRESEIGGYAADPVAIECSGACRMTDGYWLPTEGPARQRLRHVPLPAYAYRGTYVTTLNLNDYPSSGAISPRATRAYVRAFVRTKRACDIKSPTTPVDVKFSGECFPRFGFTNPVWALRNAWQAGQTCPTSERSLDRDLDNQPDFCDAAPEDSQPTAWTRHFGGAGYDGADATAFDAAGNLYVVARTTGAGRIERGKKAHTPFAGPDIDAMLLKYNYAGELVSRFHVMGQGAAYLTDVAVDYVGNVYVTGYFTGTAQLGNNTLTSTDGDSFVAKLRGADFSVVWVKKLAGAGYSRAVGLTLTPDGHVVALGYFAGVLATGDSNLIADGTSYDCYVVWLTASAGAQRAIQRIGGTGGCTAMKITSDSQSRAYAAALYTGTVQLGFSNKTTTSSDSMVARFGSAAEMGTPSWITWIGDPSLSDYAFVYDLDRLPNDDLVLVGRFSGTLKAAVDASPQTSFGVATGWSDAFVLTLTRTTGVPVAPPSWRIGGTSDEALSAVTVDTSGRILASGWFNSGTVPTAVGTLVRNGSADGFAVLFDPARTLQWANAFGTQSSSSGNTAAFSADGRMTFGGAVSGPPSAGTQDGFVSVSRTP